MGDLLSKGLVQASAKTRSKGERKRLIMANQLFGPGMWDKLREDKLTAEYLKDPAFEANLRSLQQDPSTLSQYVQDTRILRALQILGSVGVGAKPKGTEGEAMEDVVEEVAEEELDDKAKALREKEKGNVAYKKRDFPAAIEAYGRAIELDADNMAYLTNRAAALLESGDFEGCIKDCKSAVDINAEKSLRTDFKIIARAWGRMGTAYVRSGNLAEGISAFHKCLLEVNDPKISKALRDAEAAKKKADEEAYLDPEISNAVRAEGNALFKEGKFPESIKKYGEAIKRNPSDAAPYSNRAAAYIKLGELPMALKDCDRCLAIDPVNLKAHIRKGNIHFFLKEYHKCLTIYEKGLKIDPNSNELRKGLLKTQMKIQEQQNSGEIDEAQVQQAMQDPEIQQILSDPQMNNVLKQMQEDPKFAGKAMRDPDISGKIQKLIAAGVLRTG